MVVQLNRVVTVYILGAEKNDQGGLTAVVRDSWQRRANVRERSGGSSVPYGQTVWEYDCVVRMRYERTRRMQSNYQIFYQGQHMKVNQVVRLNERFKEYIDCYCSYVDGEVGLPEPPITQNVLGESAQVGISFNETLILV